MRIRVLGALELHDGVRPVALGTPKQKAVMALLLIRAGTVVTVEELLDELWQRDPPSSALMNLRSYAGGLRRLLATTADAPVLTKRGSGYLISVDTSTFDLPRFRTLAAAGRAALDGGELAAAAEQLQEALELWRGPALVDVPLGPALSAWQVAVQEQRMASTENHIQALLGLGRYDQAATHARQMMSAEPLRERAHALLIRARYHNGDVAGALLAYDTIRRTLLEELGIEPGFELRELHRAMLNRDPALLAGPPGGRVRVSDQHTGAAAVRLDRVVPRQLPSEVAGFTGRDGYLRRLDALLSTEDSERPAAVVLSAIAGTAGVGKTALAVHWAHRVAGRFPDGQIYINLRGFDPAGSALEPGEALRFMVESFDVAPQRIPATIEGQVGLYRSVLADKRVLIVLDNARDADQVRPLLPGAPGCLVIVTSRSQLSGLIATDVAHPLTVDLLTIDEARAMLARRLGRQRVEAEPVAVDEIIALCARLPMALAIVAARAAAHPDFTLDAVAAQLRKASGGLDAFEDGESATDIRAIFSWSYHILTPAAARMFRLLGVHPGLDITASAAASLTGTQLRAVRPALAELARAHLLREHTPGRYTCHDLLRAYAAELTEAGDPAADRAAATHRVLDHYLHTAHAADRLLRPDREPISMLGAQPGVTPERLDDHAQALVWFTTEYPLLLASVHHAVNTGYPGHAWRLTWTLEHFFDWRGHWHELAGAQQIALTAAQRAGDVLGQAHTHRGLARVHTRLGSLDDALVHLRLALGLFCELDDAVGQAATHRNLGLVLSRQGHRQQALRHSQQALELHRAAGHLGGQAVTLNNLGLEHALLGDYEQGLFYCQQALSLYEQVGDPDGEAHTWDSLGYIASNLGDHTEAIASYRRAIHLFQAIGDRYTEAVTLINLGDAYRAADDPTARRAWQRALEVFEALDHPDAAKARARLAGQ